MNPIAVRGGWEVRAARSARQSAAIRQPPIAREYVSALLDGGAGVNDATRSIHRRAVDRGCLEFSGWVLSPPPTTAATRVCQRRRWSECVPTTTAAGDSLSSGGGQLISVRLPSAAVSGGRCALVDVCAAWSDFPHGLVMLDQSLQNLRGIFLALPEDGGDS